MASEFYQSLFEGEQIDEGIRKILDGEVDDAVTAAKSYAIGGTDSREGEDTDNAKYYKEQAEETLEEAESVAEAVEVLQDIAIEQALQARESAEAAQLSAENAEDAKEAIENMQVSATTGTPESEATVEKTLEDGITKLSFTIPKGDKGDAFVTEETYSSVAEMNANYATDGLELGAYVIISTEDREDPDYGAVYQKGETAYAFVLCMRGEKGDKGDTGNGIEAVTKTGTEGLIDTYEIEFDNGDSTEFTVKNGSNAQWGIPLFVIEGDDLIMYYPDENTEPSVMINNDGDLILEVW